MTFWNFSSSTMDLDFTDGLHFFEPEPFISSAVYDSKQYPLHHQIYPGIKEHIAEITTSLVPSESSPIGESLVLKDRLMVAIEYLKEYVEYSDVLIQIWMPTMIEAQIVLTTADQPYSLNPNCKSLASYRNASKSFHLATEEDSQESAGLPGRVFLGKFPEWTPDVRFFRSEECPRKCYAKMYNISGCLALPVFDQENGICLAVIEIVTTTQKISYHLELEIVCKALEAVDLRSSQDFIPLGVKACSESYQIAVPDISEIVQSICETYRLPLAETWALHDRQFGNEHRQFDYCISTVDSACYVADNDLLGFHEACSEQYLFLDQGIVGKAFTTNKQWFATDITSFSKTNYPLSHHARMFNLGAAIAIPLGNLYTGSVQLVLELFLPKDCRDIEKQKQLWNLLPSVIQQHCQSFHVIMDKEIVDYATEKPIIGSLKRLDDEGIQNFISFECLKEEPEYEFNVITQWGNNDLDSFQEQVFSDFKQLQRNSTLIVEKSSSLRSRTATDKKQNKIEKTITLQILRNYFSGSLKDAAKSIGVCPTTLKRICRQHGINRWPARKIKKGNRSLRKLQLVVDSIHGSEGLLQIDSFYKTFPEFNSPIPEKEPFSPFKKSDKSIKTNPESDSGSFNPKTSDEKSQSSSLLKSTSGFRVKATFGEEHVRFSLVQNWSFKEFQQEIAKRFKLDDFSRIDIKYMDIENEPVLLTCDADLEECLDLLSFSSCNIIKISLHKAFQPNQSSSFTSQGLC